MEIQKPLRGFAISFICSTIRHCSRLSFDTIKNASYSHSKILNIFFSEQKKISGYSCDHEDEYFLFYLPFANITSAFGHPVVASIFYLLSKFRIEYPITICRILSCHFWWRTGCYERINVLCNSKIIKSFGTPG